MTKFKDGDTVKRIAHGHDFAPSGFTSVVTVIDGRAHYTDTGGRKCVIVSGQWEVVTPTFKVEAGKSYLNTNGDIVGPLKPFPLKDRFIAVEDDGRIWDETGRAFGSAKPLYDLVQEVFVVADGEYVITVSGERIGPVTRMNCHKSTDPAGFYYHTPQHVGGHYSNGQRIKNEKGPKDFASIAPAVLKLEIGKYYQTRNGRIIGPAKKGWSADKFEFDGLWDHCHHADGTYWGDDPGLNIVKEVPAPTTTQDVFSEPGSAVTAGAVQTTTKTVTEKTIVEGRYGPDKNLIVGKLGTSGERVSLKLNNRFYDKADIAELVKLLNGIADALPEART